jgi:hypothetical protein
LRGIKADELLNSALKRYCLLLKKFFTAPWLVTMLRNLLLCKEGAWSAQLQIRGPGRKRASATFLQDRNRLDARGDSVIFYEIPGMRLSGDHGHQ